MATKKDKPNFELVDDIAPVTVGDPAAADDLAIDQEHLEEYVSSGSEGEAGAVECKRPPKGIFFTARAEISTPESGGGRHHSSRANRTLRDDARRRSLVGFKARPGWSVDSLQRKCEEYSQLCRRQR